MKNILLTLTLLLSLTSAVVNGQAVDCSEFQVSRQLAPLLSLDYVINIDDDATGQGTMTTRLTLGQLGWIGFGLSPDGESMVPGEAVIGSDAGVLKYSLGGKSEAAVLPNLPQTLTDISFEQNETHTVLEYTKVLLEENELYFTTLGDNDFIWAYGDSNDANFHIARGFDTFTLEACAEGVGAAITPAPVVAANTPAPVAAPEEPSVSPSDLPPVIASDCTDFQQTIQLGEDLILEAVVNPTDDGENGILRGRLTLDGEGWIGFGIHEDGASSMTPADAIIGVPGLTNSVNNPGKYDLTSRSLAGVTLMADERQTLLDSSIEQVNGQTILTFSKLLVEDGETDINGDGINTFIWAFGPSNDLSQHTAADRGAIQIRLRTCIPGEAPPDDDDLSDGGIIQLETFQELWTSHGVFAGIAWGILCPLAIGSSLLRKFFPAGPIWLTVHLSLNSTVFIFTAIAFGLAIAAQEKGTGEGDSANHFTNRTHSAVGLIIMILTFVQVVGGVLRPHAPHKDESTGILEEKKPVRFGWELMHKGAGFGILATAWWQVQDGLKLYATRFGSTDLTTVFWIIVGGLAGSIAILMAFSKYGADTPAAAASSAGEHAKMETVDDGEQVT